MISHKGTVTLETDRFILRKFKLSDAEDMLTNWASDPDVARFVPWEPLKTLVSAEECVIKT